MRVERNDWAASWSYKWIGYATANVTPHHQVLAVTNGRTKLGTRAKLWYKLRFGDRSNMILLDRTAHGLQDN